MAQLINLESSLIRSIKYELAAFERDYNTSIKDLKSLSALKFHRNELEKIWEKINSKYDALLESALLDDPEKEKTINLKETQEKFLGAKNFYRRSMISIVDSIDVFESSKQSNTLPEPHITTPTSCFSLPPCDIEVFDGNYTSWPSFRDLFTAIYGSNPRLSGVEKLFYLKQKTHGEAKEVVDTAPLTNDGFQVAWENLTCQYENSRMQVNAQIKTLFSLPSVCDSSGAAVRNLQRLINGCINQLKTLKIKTDHWDPLLIYLCSSKLPVEILTKFEDTLSDPSEIPHWMEMDAFLTNTYRSLDSVADIKNTIIGPAQNYRNRAHITRHHSTSAQTTQSHPTNTSNGSKCKLCQGNHILRECPSFIALSVGDKRNVVASNGCCYNCLAVSHTVNDCRSTFSCRHCGNRHNTLLHIPVSNPNIQNIHHNEQPSMSRANTSQTFSILTKSQTILDNRRRLLGTAVLKVDIHGSLHSARALIDPASDFSFISENLVNILHLPTTPISVEISGLNEVVSARSNKLCEVVLRSNTRPDFSLKIQAIVVNTLTRTLPTQNITPCFTKDLDRIKLADPRYYESRPIDFIIGSDFYPHILRSGVKKNILNSIIAQDTEFGWILTGPAEEKQTLRTSGSYFCAVNLSEPNEVIKVCSIAGGRIPPIEWRNENIFMNNDYALTRISTAIK